MAEGSYQPVELGQTLPGGPFDGRDDLNGYGRVLSGGEAGGAGLVGDGAQLMGDDIVQFAGEAAALFVVDMLGGGGGHIAVGAGTAARAENRFCPLASFIAKHPIATTATAVGHRRLHRKGID
jgi:hypothetical protein